MDEFAWSDLLQAMLLAARWTVALSVAAFAGGGIVAALLLLVRLSNWRVVRWLYRGYI